MRSVEFFFRYASGFRVSRLDVPDNVEYLFRVVASLCDVAGFIGLRANLNPSESVEVWEQFVGELTGRILNAGLVSQIAVDATSRLHFDCVPDDSLIVTPKHRPVAKCDGKFVLFAGFRRIRALPEIWNS